MRRHRACAANESVRSDNNGYPWVVVPRRLCNSDKERATSWASKPACAIAHLHRGPRVRVRLVVFEPQAAEQG
eukprot:scaffold128437_cov27-Tisochrysis_lutea.AAC.3